MFSRRKYYRFSANLLASDLSVFSFGLIDFFFLLQVSTLAAGMVGYADTVVNVTASLLTGHLVLYINRLGHGTIERGTFFTTAVYTALMCTLGVAVYLLALRPLFSTFLNAQQYDVLTNNLDITIFGLFLILITRQFDMLVRIRISSSVALPLLIGCLGLNSLLNYVGLKHVAVTSPEATVALATLISRAVYLALLAGVCVKHWDKVQDAFGVHLLRPLMKIYTTGAWNIGIRNALDWGSSVVAGSLMAALGGPAIIAYQVYVKLMTLTYRVPQALVSASHVFYTREVDDDAEQIDRSLALRLFKLLSLPSIAVAATLFFFAPFILGLMGIPKGHESHGLAVFFVRIEVCLILFYLIEQFVSVIMVSTYNTALIRNASIVVSITGAIMMAVAGLIYKSPVGIVIAENLALVMAGTIYFFAFRKMTASAVLNLDPAGTKAI
ncbi:hypothetical protein C8263_17290 [Deinococcus arcticus]|uniref:Uncharacterized protein n=1 Tax=Deinococcus arcticus TaxID=2136176 RepID=A0A2T3W3U3_9DEIO|nr:hypothetical protein C8263_17290 [Deinococcus arcticus]